MKPSLKTCFVSLNSYPLFKTNHLGYFGGAELQISLIAKELARDKRFKVSVVVADYGKKTAPQINNLNLYRAFRKQHSLYWETIRFFWLLKKINADIYIERTLNLKVGLICLFCKLFKKKFIYMIAHDWDCQPDFNNYLKGLSRISFRYGLTQADLVICQTKTQQVKLNKNFGIQAILMRSVVKPPPKISKEPKSTVLWVGRSDKWKQPKKFINLAKTLPKEKFIMVCRQGNDWQYYSEIKALTKKTPNLKFIKAVNYRKIIDYFQKAKIFVNTSVAEGFPNTFLQAGITKTPVFSFIVNPNNYLNQYHCGIVSQQKLNQLLNNPNRLRIMGENHYQYVNKYHSLENIEIFKQTLYKLV